MCFRLIQEGEQAEQKGKQGSPGGNPMRLARRGSHDKQNRNPWLILVRMRQDGIGAFSFGHKKDLGYQQIHVQK